MIQILKDYYWAFRSIFHQRSEIREYLDRYVPEHADMFAPLRQFKNKHIGSAVLSLQQVLVLLLKM